MDHAGGEAATGEHRKHRQRGDEARRECGGDEPCGGPLRERPADEGGKTDRGERCGGGDKLPRHQRGHRIRGHEGCGHETTSSANPSLEGGTIHAGGTLPRWPRHHAHEEVADEMVAVSGS